MILSMSRVIFTLLLICHMLAAPFAQRGCLDGPLNASSDGASCVVQARSVCCGDEFGQDLNCTGECSCCVKAPAENPPLPLQPGPSIPGIGKTFLVANNPASAVDGLFLLDVFVHVRNVSLAPPPLTVSARLSRVCRWVV
jgi:hypothetical protein